MAGLDLLVVRAEDTERGTAADFAFVHSPVRVGRSAGNDIPLAQPFASAWHGLIEFDARGVRYTDLGSTNGSAVAGIRVEPRQAVEVAPGAEVAIGSYRITFPSRPVPGEAADARRATTAPPLGPLVTTERPPAGSITALMQQLARAPSEDAEKSWKHVLFPGAVIGRFELIREVGRGGFGVVYEAKDRQLGRLVAFKAVRPGRNSLVMYRQQRLQQEAEAVASLTHPNIVSLFDLGSCESGPYLIFELLRGKTLFERLRGGPLPLPEALEIAIQIGWALDHAHAAGVVHRDLKPSNVFLCAGGQVKVLDFGIADVLGATDSRKAGTPPYMAPEQWRGLPTDASTDVFGAAVMLFESISGKLPYKASADTSAVLEPGARPDLQGVEMPARLRSLLRSALDPDPKKRARDGHAWLAGLLAVQEQLDAPRSEPVSRSGRDRPGWVVAAALGVAGVLLLAGLYWLLSP
jgi:pSer/pThr/pTyr-binding forkhead associated (FHA) protein